MGTNYYLIEQSRRCATCGHDPTERLHIGKSSGGWCFALHVMPEIGILDLDDWRKRWTAEGARIEDEYGRPVTIAEMESEITDRSWSRRDSAPFDYHANHAEPGPKGLVRCSIGRYCVGHGAGTWDLIPGEFS